MDCSFREAGRRIGSALVEPLTQFFLFGAVGYKVGALLASLGLLLPFVQIRERYPSFWGGHSSMPRCTAWRVSTRWLSASTCPIDRHFCTVPNWHNCTGQCYLMVLGAGKVSLEWLLSSYPVVHPHVIFTEHSPQPYLAHPPECPVSFLFSWPWFGTTRILYFQP